MLGSLESKEGNRFHVAATQLQAPVDLQRQLLWTAAAANATVTESCGGYRYLSAFHPNVGAEFGSGHDLEVRRCAHAIVQPFRCRRGGEPAQVRRRSEQVATEVKTEHLPPLRQ